MSATEELRRLLDERGAEWSSPSGLNSSFADSITFIGDVAVVSEIDGSDLLRINFDGTPEQAIEATLGQGTCRMSHSTEYAECKLDEFECSECGWRGVIDDMLAEVKYPRFCPNCRRKVER